ncbi:hypothetical protein EW146_g8423 [Bondarzewia mesenterica]|uniref:AB hydrolase-1 domain-containing protein n=1 Tax=Bondarzewia mesenterica TaxID=1095465 RepID=A0A4S4LG98_9AGAM|nr:hypothetical protein EW146_g8423 [Bondarzewia mesenterica]
MHLEGSISRRSPLVLLDQCPLLPPAECVQRKQNSPVMDDDDDIHLHGFPSSSWDWSSQVMFFKPRRYGLIILDMLGYAGTDKPMDLKVYVGSGLARDIVDIMDNEGVQKGIIVGHDWYVAVGYVPPNPVHDPVAQAAMMKQMIGRDLYGYWAYFSEEGTEKTIEQNVRCLCISGSTANSWMWICASPSLPDRICFFHRIPVAKKAESPVDQLESIIEQTFDHGSAKSEVSHARELKVEDQEEDEAEGEEGEGDESEDVHTLTVLVALREPPSIFLLWTHSSCTSMAGRLAKLLYPPRMPESGEYHWRDGGEPHINDPSSIMNLQDAVHENQKAYDAYAQNANNQAKRI